MLGYRCRTHWILRRAEICGVRGGRVKSKTRLIATATLVSSVLLQPAKARLNRREEIRDDSANPPPALVFVLADWAENEAETGLPGPQKFASSNDSLSLDIRFAAQGPIF
jgi:hypothetical protein